MTETSQPVSVLRRIQLVLSNPWVKTVLAFAVLGLLVYWLRDQMPFLAEGWRAVRNIHWGWLIIALGFSYLSMSSYGSVQKTLLNSAGVKVGYWDSVGLIFAANAIATSIPGGQVFSATLTYRRTRQWGATRVIASWQLVISGVLATIGIVLLALLGFFLVGAVSNPFLLTLSGIALFAVIFGVQWAARHPDRIESVVMTVLRWINGKRGKPANHGSESVKSIIDQADAVDLSRRHLGSAFFWSLLNWVADIGCLWAAAAAVGAQHSIGGLAIAYVTGKVVAMVPVTPGGLGTVEVTLIGTLTAGGMPADLALATVFVYRVVSYFLVAAAGWVIFILFYRSATDIDPDIDEPAPGALGNTGATRATASAATSVEGEEAAGLEPEADTTIPPLVDSVRHSAVEVSRWPFKGRTYSPVRRSGENDGGQPAPGHGGTGLTGNDEGPEVRPR
ncbi:MAG TPA: YbhN family protein [Dietzia timorensis]|uniref:YbhN family protein n=1 Tax=Dietzia timorensis TaxID=499555 RepID=A0A921F488_9ACTN|nr:YbhN family protein [Dietzia timorensis]HJE91225.1 YbhN family protein [Dietzia timorensis]